MTIRREGEGANTHPGGFAKSTSGGKGGRPLSAGKDKNRSLWLSAGRGTTVLLKQERDVVETERS